MAIASSDSSVHPSVPAFKVSTSVDPGRVATRVSASGGSLPRPTSRKRKAEWDGDGTGLQSGNLSTELDSTVSGKCMCNMC